MSVEIGSYLRQAREAIGLSLDQLQEKTKIQKSFLIAIENGEFDKLPSPFYVRTYLRSYANCVKIEPHHILRQYRKIEQAERFNTTVHKAITENDLAQTQINPLAGQLTGRMPTINQATGVHKPVGQETNSFRLPSINQKPGQSRINTQTALTAPRTESDKVRRDKELARRDAGYQQTTGMLKGIPQQRQEMEKTVPGVSQATFNQPKVTAPQVVEENMAKQETAATQALPSRRTRDNQKVSPVATGPTSMLSRTAKMKKVDVGSTNTLPPVREPFGHEQEHDDLNNQQTVQMSSLSRSAVKNRKSKKAAKTSRKKPKRSVIIAAAGLALCIPIAWGVASFVGDDGKDMNKDPNNAGGGQNVTKPAPTPEPTPAPAKTGTLKFISSGKTTDHYRVSGTEAQIEVEATGELGLDLRYKADGTPFKDVRLSVGEPFTYKHEFAKSPDIYIYLNNPANAKVTVNGEPVQKSVTFIHLKQDSQ
ncbi:helix-turn-helix domain-containing protein [Laceyella putida]|uniref:Helix-turn-helix domain-containing protein n=1 Tax=Laceyella putida TaxID=110101 RepID=A0ABW2RKD6_9BACL